MGPKKAQKGSRGNSSGWGISPLQTHEDGSDPTKSIGSGQRNRRAWNTGAQLLRVVWLDEEFWESSPGAADPQLVFPPVTSQVGAGGSPDPRKPLVMSFWGKTGVLQPLRGVRALPSPPKLPVNWDFPTKVTGNKSASGETGAGRFPLILLGVLAWGGFTCHCWALGCPPCWSCPA